MSTFIKNTMRDIFLKMPAAAIWLLVCFILTSCTSSSDSAPAPARLVRSDFSPGEVSNLSKASIDTAGKALDAIAAVPEDQRTIDNTLLALESALADLNDNTTPLSFMGYVSTDDGISSEGSQAEEAVGQFNVKIGTRRDLYQAIAKAVPRNTDEARLLRQTLKNFESNGLKLSDDALAQVRDLMGQLVTKETEFSENLNNDTSTVLFTPAEIAGLPADYIAGLQKDAGGNYIVNTKESDYLMVRANAASASARKKMLLGFLTRGGSTNSQLLADAVVLRAKIAHLMGYQTWGDYQTDGKMAKSSAAVLSFLNNLKSGLAAQCQTDLARLLAFKRESIPDAASLDQWDIDYYSYQLQKRDYTLDDEIIREYFPADVVVTGMFQVYSKMLGLRFEEVTGAKVWADNVKLYAVHNSSDDRVIAYFYTDFFPRAGKYGHQAAFPLIAGRILASGNYSYPIAAIVGNLNPPVNGKPSLLSHDDVVTLFHEFGHIMHMTLTRAPYARLSGTNVAQDFVEAPSQMLENWVWSPDVLSAISGHYLDHSKKLPADLLQRMIAARDFNQGYVYTKQLLYALYDMTLHTQDGPVDVNQVYLDLYRRVLGQEPAAGQQFPASFEHLMGGYDAGYYGYLWSQVYAQDMFSQFPSDNLTSPEVGARYRKEILEKGNMKDAIDLLRAFLGREPNSDAFLKKLHIGS